MGGLLGKCRRVVYNRYIDKVKNKVLEGKLVSIIKTWTPIIATYLGVTAVLGYALYAKLVG